MQHITYGLSHVFGPESDPVENAAVLRILLDTLVAINVEYKRAHAAPLLRRSGVRYGRTKIWEPIPALYIRGYGDCKSLTAAEIADLQSEGIECEPVFRFMNNDDGSTDYHIVVQTAKGFTDPSKRHGMPVSEIARFYR